MRILKSWDWATVPTLIRLRYQLLWAQARTSTGKWALLALLYVAGISIFLFLSLGGFGAAVAAIKLGRGEQISLWILTGIFFNGLIIGLISGVGPRRAFSETVLRRYPMTATARLVARHVTGFLEPAWPLVLALVLGLAVGFAITNPLRILVGLPVAVLFALVCYLSAVTMLATIERLLQYRAGAIALGAIFVVLVTTLSLFVPLAARSHSPRGLFAAELALRYLPPGIAASALAGTDLRMMLLNGAALIIWCLLLGRVLGSLERRPPIATVEAHTEIPWDNPYDRLARRCGSDLGPLVAKALRYHLRCDRVRLGLALAVPGMVFLPNILSFSQRQPAAHEATFMFTLLLFFGGACSGTQAMTVNQFGCDGPGIRRYFSFPVPFAWALRAASIASLALGALVILVALATWMAISGSPFDARKPLMLLLSGTSGLLLFSSLGLWTTVLSPKAINFRGVLGNYQSLGGNLVMLGQVFVLVIPLNLVMAGDVSWQQLRGSWWVLALLAVICAGLYFASLVLINPVLKSRRDRLVRAIAGPRFN